MTDQRSPKDIERDIEQQRAGLKNSIEDLQERFSLDGIVQQLTDQFRQHGGDIGASVSRSVRENPMALALTGVGLAWMIFGNNDRPQRMVSRNGRHQDRYSRARQDWSHDDDDRFGASAFDGRNHDSQPGMARGIAGSGSQPAWMHSYDDPYGTSDDDNDDGGMADRARAMGASVSQGASSMGRAASDHAATMGQSVSDRARSARDSIADASDRASERAAKLRRQLAEGTESLGEEARARVIAARERAHEARTAAMEYARQGGRKAADLYREQPLIAGALALALGAAVAAALPRTRLEDEYMGDESDALIDEAERMFEEERAKVTKVAKAAMDEVGVIVDEAKDAAGQAKADADERAPADTAAQAMADKAGEAGQRVADAAKAEAKKQELGKAEV